MLVQTSSPLHHCSSGPSNSLPSGVLQPKTYPSSERPVNHLSRSPRQYIFWTCLHLRWYWGPDNCCKPTNAPSHRPRRLREVLQLTPTSLSLETPTPPLDTDTAGHPNRVPPHPNHAPSTGVLATSARFANAPYPWTIPYVAHRGIPFNINRPSFPLSLPATLPLHPYEACHILGSLPHMRLRLQPAVLGNVSQLLLQTDAPDPHLTHGRYFGVRSAATSLTAPAFQPHPSSKGTPTFLRRPSVQSSTPFGSSPTTIPKSLRRQPQTTALN